MMMNKYRHRSNTNPIMPPSCPTMPYPHHHNMVPTAPTRKRTHLKPSQVAVLQESFVTNPLPDASIRCRLARELGVTERTIQIWFQNRRAKARKLEASCHGMTSGKIPSLMPNVRTGWIEPPPRHHQQSNNGNNQSPQRYQATFRTMMTPERFEEMQQQQQNQNQQEQVSNWEQQRKRPRSYSKPETVSSHLQDEQEENTIRAMSEGTDRMISKQDPNQQVTFPVAALRVGSWARYAGLNDQQWDLVCYCHQRQLIWQIQDDGHQFRIQIDFSAIQQLMLTSQIQEDMTVSDQIQVHLHHPGDLTFSMLRQGIDQDWIRCGDFSENKQATYQSIHVLQGNHDMLRQAMFDLLNQAPDMVTKCTIAAPHIISNNASPIMEEQIHPPALELCRDYTLSPSATPEPAMTTTNTMYSNPTSWMMPSNAYIANKASGLDENVWLQHQQQPWDNSWQVLQQQQQPSTSSFTSSTTMDVNFL